jgi:hypothetical protein
MIFMTEEIKLHCVACRKNVEENEIELIIEGVGVVCSQCAKYYETAHWGE